jgi:cytochrome oxidase assembly protein ShyY1
MPRFLLKPRWVLVHLLAALIVSVCIALGQWQLNRLSERRAENARIARQTALAPEGLDELLPSPRLPYRHAEDLAYRRVNVRGTYDAGREVVLLTRSNGEQNGNHVLTPLVTSQGAAVIVNRGWVPLTMDRPPVPEAAPPDGPVEVTGLLLPSEPRGRFEPSVSQSDTVKAVSRIDLSRLSKQLPYQTYPLYLRLETELPTSGRRLPETVPLPAPNEGPHLSYAIQWFAFASIALVTYAALIRKEFKTEH